MPFIINFFGDGLRLWNCQMTTEEFTCFKKYKEENELEWESIFFDLHVLDVLGYQSWTDFSVQESFGLIINAKSTIEVKQRTKRMLKIKSEEIMNQTILFELYKTSISKPIVKARKGFVDFYLTSSEIGTIGKYKIESEKIKVDKFHFKIKSLDQMNCFYIDGMSYDSEDLTNLREDTITRGFGVIMQS
jgi:hypothetical protein